ncbi:scavenger receptor class F member 2-like [Haliotis cracherodii]|uniref:scavenger receptor class F member 2-like n=1 Tax=Haliotis cracherodii TaxID=6455 RepID=UPI0039ED94CF
MYGPGCRENCSEGCLDGECRGTDGTCQCRDGWKGDRCHLDCEPGFYGPGCAVSCSPNCAGTRCGRSTGLCFSCQSGWTGESCQQADGMPASATGGIVAAGLLIILLVVIIAVVLISRKYGRKEEPGVRNDASHLVKLITIKKFSLSTTPKKGGCS